MRIQKLQEFLFEKNLSGLIVDNPVDLFYLTGLNLSQGRLFVGISGAYLFVDGRYFDACKRMTSIPLFPSENWGFKKFLLKYKEGKKIGFDANYTSYESFIQLSSFCGKKFILSPLERPCLLLRSVKEKKEISKIQKAARLNMQAMNYAQTLLKEGVFEKEIAKQIELFFLMNGGDKVSFDPIVAFGENAAECHYHPSMKRKLKKGDCVLIDIGVSIDHYNSDLSRTFFYGKPLPELKKIYRIVLKALQASLSICKPEMTVKEIDQAARTVITKAGYGDYFPHATGHGVGLDIHEYPRIKEGKTSLVEGMVITIEPGIYLPHIGGVRLEELIVITKNGYKNMTAKKWALDEAEK